MSKKVDAKRECFVISPIGAEGSDTRQHADIVYECIIKPACEDLFGSDGNLYHPERGDHKSAPGKITDQIYEDILSADLIIVVLTESNPNVYYELAIAQAAAKSVILLLEKGFDVPFDIKDQRIIYYDFDPKSMFHRNYAKQLRNAMNALDDNPKKPVVSFAPHLTPLGNPMQTVGARASEAEDAALNIVSNTDRFFWMMGFSLKGWTMNHDFVSALQAKATILPDGVRTLIISSDNPSMEPSMKSPDIFEAASQSAMVAQKSWKKVFQKLKPKQAELRIAKSKSLNYQIMMSEKEALIIPYLTSRDTLRSPFILAKRGSFYHDAIREEFSFLWEHSVPPKQVKTAKA